jgi:hypothetical protein
VGVFQAAAFALLAVSLGAAAGELSVDDFCFEGPLGSRGASIEKLGPEHFKVNLARVPEKPEWSNMLQFTLLRNAKEDLEGIMASESPVSLCWSMHTWEGEKVEPLLRPGADMGTTLGPWTDLRDIIARHDTRSNFKPLVVLTSALQPTHWTSGTHKQFGISAICCEGAANLYTKEENLHTGKVLMQSVAEYYRGTKP